MLQHQGTVERSNADGHRCINSTLVNLLTKGQGGPGPPWEIPNFRLTDYNKIFS